MSNDSKNFKPKNTPLDKDLDNIPEVALGDPEGETEVIGVKFQNSGKVYSFSPLTTTFEAQDHVIVQTARGVEYGLVTVPNHMVPTKTVIPPLRPVIRKADEQDAEHNKQNHIKEKDAFATCLEKIQAHQLEMKLIDAEYTFDNSKLVFYFSAEGRIDFRDLVKDLASVFHTRIELRQIGIRDEAKMLGGLGICGQPFCCSTFLTDFAQVSIKMAKEQNLSLNSSKISGTCGRLMCCLRYESEVYEEGLKITPPVDAKVESPEGIGQVTESNPLTGICKVIVKDSANNECIKLFHRDQLKVLSKDKKRQEPVENTENQDS